MSSKPPIIKSSNPEKLPVVEDDLFEEVSAAKQQLIDNEAKALLARAKDEKLGSRQRQILIERAMARLSAKKGQSSRTRIDYSLPSPTIQRYAAFNVIPVPDEELTRDAFLDILLENLVDLLTDERKETDQEMYDAIGDGVPANASPDVANNFAEVEKKRDEICDNHYALVAAGCELFHVLDSLMRTYDAISFLHFKDALANALIEYNAHNPYLYIRLEQIGLKGVQSELSKLTAKVIDYLIGPDFRAVVNRGADLSAATPAGTARPPGAPVFTINVTKMKMAAKQSNKVIIDKKKDVIKSIFQVTTEPASIDISDGRDPVEIVQNFDDLFTKLVEHGNGLVGEIHDLAAAINYNINTNRFGSTASVADNVSKMAEVRRRLIRLINQRRRVAGKARPARILIMSLFEWRAFNLGIGPCDLVSTQTFFANEERKIRLKTSQTDKSTRAQTQNVLTSNSQEVQDNFEKTVEKEINDTNSSSVDRNDYMDQNRQQTDTFTKSNNIGGGINIPYIGLNFSAGTNDSTNNTVTSGDKSGSSVNTNNTCEKATRNFESAVTGQVRTTASKQEVSVTDSTETTSETNKEETTEITVKNPNEASPVTVAFYTIVQEFLTTHTLADMRIIFWNGQVKAEFLLQEVGLMLDTYIRQGSSIRNLVLEEIARSGIRFDYLNRRFKVIDDSSGAPTFINQLYLNQLSKFKAEGANNNLDESEDEALEEFKVHLRGIVVKVSRHTIPRPGLLSRSFVDEPALDSNQTALWEQTLRTRSAEAALKEGEAKKQDYLLEVVKAITDPEKRAEYASRLLIPPAQLLNSTYLAQFLNSAKDGSDLSKMIKLTK